MVKKWSEYKAAQRVKRAEAGLKRYEFYLHPSEWPLVKRYIERLARRRERT